MDHRRIHLVQWDVTLKLFIAKLKLGIDSLQQTSETQIKCMEVIVRQGGTAGVLDSPSGLDDNMFPTDQQDEDNQLVAIVAADGEDTGTIYQAMLMSDMLPKQAEPKLNLDEQKEYTEGWNIQHKDEGGQEQMNHSTSSSSTDLSISQSSSSSSLNYKAATCPSKPPDETAASDQRRYSSSSVPHSPLYSRSPLPEVTVKKDIQLAGSVNTNCYNAAVNEGLGCESNINISRYIAKARNLISRKHGLSEYCTERKSEKQLKHSSAYVQYEHAPVLSDTSSDQEREPLNLLHGQASVLPGSSILQSAVTQTFSMPSLGNQTLLLSSLPLCNEESSFPVKQLGIDSASTHTNRTQVCSSEVTAKSCSRSTPWDNTVPDMKKYRYNQTAMALQQSGLMKTTIKTAELLRKSRLLQEELRKLRRETAFLVQSVLNNPENKHIKELYFNQPQTQSFKS
ncbi:hypothetical protein DPMN_071424 [Dreissena polymorpha]|uniref:Uncharacterized protein n=1 Tax=Dreissena polymorpha TaxID=45954 RepID=A0A9D3Z2L9_DREPO|nr:hypothetical protein DPMN_071424 [Dreissena polymorpha]